MKHRTPKDDQSSKSSAMKNGSKTTETPSTTIRPNKPRRNSAKSSKQSFVARHKVSFTILVISLAAYILLKKTYFSTTDDDDMSSTATNATLSENTTMADLDNVETIGGWRLASEDTLLRYDPGVCNIPRVSIDDLPPSRFESEFRFRQPVLVTFPDGADGWTQAVNWTRDSLVEVYRNWTVHSGQSLDIVRKGGNAEHASSFLGFVDKLISSEESDTQEPLHYAFDRAFYWNSKLPETLHMPPYFQVNTSTDESIFFLGASRTGVVFHKHSDTWNGVVFGRKRWFLYNNTLGPPGGVHHGFTLLDWVNKVYPLLSEDRKPIECVQEAGEILYLPEGMYHSTLNLGDTIAVAIQKKTASTEVELLSYQATDLNYKVQRTEDKEEETRMHQMLVEVYEQIHELLPDNSEALMKLGNYRLELGDYVESIGHSMKAIKLDPYFILAYHNMGKALMKIKEYDRAEITFKRALELSPNLWDGYREYGEFLIKRGRCTDALPILKRGTELRPDLRPFWYYYLQCQKETGDEEGAQLTEEIIEMLEEKEQEWNES